MYRVGFGDCFLVTVPPDRHVLVDCGVHPLGDIGTLDRVLDDVAAVSGGRLDVVIASHAHEDHVSGFARGEALFRKLEIGEVWLPWTESPLDAVAYRLRSARAQSTGRLAGVAAAAGTSPAVRAVVANAAGDAVRSAVALLRSGFGQPAKVRYLAAGDTVEDAGGIPGFGARILGPTSDAPALSTLEAPRAERIAAPGEQPAEHALEPFADDWTRDAAAAPSLTDAERRRLVRAVETSADQVAFGLDRAINNTSLVCLFTYGDRSLLFPGDAHYGSWAAWLELNDAAAILAGLDFYKVSHHGSENATPRAAVARMLNDGLAAMASTQSWPWASIPDDALLQALGERTSGRFERSDRLAVGPAAAYPGAAAEPSPGFTQGPFWIDYTLPL